MAGRKKKAPKKCSPKQRPRKPQKWEKAVMAAYVVMLGGTTEQAAVAAGCAIRTVDSWRAADWWTGAKEEAITRWKGDVLSAAQRSLLGVLKDKDPHTTRWALERMMPETFLPLPHPPDPDSDKDIEVTIRIGAEVPDSDQ